MNALDRHMTGAQNMNDALDGAKLVATDGNGRLAIWYGGYGFNVYDAAGDWGEVDHFTSGELAAMTEAAPKKPVAARHLETRGYSVING